MSQAKHTPGPWKVRNAREVFKGGRRICSVNAGESLCLGEEMKRAAQNARLIASAPELLEVLHECIDAQWVIDSHAVEFDGTVHFGPYYDFSGLDGIDRHEFLAYHSCVVWPSGGKWSAYCTYEGSTWFEAFDSADAAKETCMKLLDKVMPTHPAMKARAAIAKATGGE